MAPTIELALAGICEVALKVTDLRAQISTREGKIISASCSSRDGSAIGRARITLRRNRVSKLLIILEEGMNRGYGVIPCLPSTMVPSTVGEIGSTLGVLALGRTCTSTCCPA